METLDTHDTYQLILEQIRRGVKPLHAMANTLASAGADLMDEPSRAAEHIYLRADNLPINTIAAIAAVAERAGLKTAMKSLAVEETTADGDKVTVTVPFLNVHSVAQKVAQKVDRYKQLPVRKPSFWTS